MPGRAGVATGPRLAPRVVLQSSLVGGHGIGDLADQPAQFADLGGNRVEGAARAGHAALDTFLHGVQPARHLRHLTGEVAGAARQISDLVAEVAAVAQPVADRVVQRHGGQGRQGHDRGTAGVHLEAEIEHGADRAGDDHHADRNENGADATHAINPGQPPSGHAKHK